MPGENRERNLRQASSGGREASPSSKASDLDTRARGASMIPLPRGTPPATHNQKTVKTERNRLRLIMESRGLTDAIEKERMLNV